MRRAVLGNDVIILNINNYSFKALFSILFVSQKILLDEYDYFHLFFRLFVLLLLLRCSFFLCLGVPRKILLLAYLAMLLPSEAAATASEGWVAGLMVDEANFSKAELTTVNLSFE